MIDHVYKRQMDRAWDSIGRWFWRAGISPNAITIAGTVTVLASCAAAFWHGRLLWLGLTVGIFELLDNIDGAVARVGDCATKAGAFLDATTDRVKEIALFVTIGELTGARLAATLALTAGLTASYALARARAEGAGVVDKSPPLFERLERVALACVGCALADVWSVPMAWVLWLLAAGNAVTTVQRMSGGFLALSRDERR